MLGAILASAILCALYARGGHAWMLGFVLFVPWLRSLDASPSLASALVHGYAMSLAYTAAVFSWFGMALGQYVQIGEAAGLAILLLAAPLFQPQFLVFALVRHASLRRHGPALAAIAGAAAWVATEWLVPKLLGDTLGYGLYPSRLLRQGASVGGGAGLSLLLLLANEAVAAAFSRRALGLRALAAPLGLGALAPLLLAIHGHAVLPAATEPASTSLRMGLVQSNLVAYESERQAKGTHAVVREVLDTHFAMSYDAVVRQHADAVLWPETAYPTTFGHPKSEAGAQFDREIVDTVRAAGVPFVFGTYDRDKAGEYNAAAFVSPDTGVLGFYRKTHLFPLTEYVPKWLDGPLLRQWLPWTGSWQPGNGARVFPLRLRDGREVPVLPLICLDDTDPALAIEGARLGAQAILTMSNDSWFTQHPLGARMHQMAAAFRSIETRLPQFRVTTNGYSAVIDAAGSILTDTQMGQRSLVIADVPLRSPARTLMVRWGDWVGAAATLLLAALAAWSALPAKRPQGQGDAAPAMAVLPATVALLPPAARVLAGALRAFARASLLYLCLALLFNEALRTNTLAQARLFAGLFLAPEAASWCVLFLFSAQIAVARGKLVLRRGADETEISLGDIAAVRLWSLPLPCPGLSLRLASGPRYRLALARPDVLAGLIAAGGGAPLRVRTRRRGALQAYLQAVLAKPRSRLDAPLVKYLLLPLALAIPAFHLQQHIAYGGALGEYYSYGLKAYLTAFGLWWAAWSIGVVLGEALLRTAIEAGALLAALLRPAQAAGVRRALESLGHALLFLGLPAWFLLTLFAR
jgi:apolipoprotein N-acyltransferase